MNEAKGTSVTAVVVTHNRMALLQRGIDSLRRQTVPLSILVVDNGSTDGTGAWLDRQSDLRVIHQRNVGGSGGFHTGIKAAVDGGADWVWCMDDDVFPRPDCLARLLAQAEGMSILAPRRLMDGRVFTHEFTHFDFTNPLASMHGGKIAGKKVDGPMEIAATDFEGPLIRRDVVERIGLPNKELFIFCDDTDYCLRTRLAGFKILYVPDALMDKHKFFSGDSWTVRNQKKKWKRYYQVRNEAYLNHHYGRNVLVRRLRSLVGVAGYVVPAVLSMPFTSAWTWRDLSMLWRAYADGVAERLGATLLPEDLHKDKGRG